MENKSSVYLSGEISNFGFITKQKNNNLAIWTEVNLKKTETIKKIVVAGEGKNFLVWKKPNKLEFYQKGKKRREYQLPKNERIKDIDSSLLTYQILTESGKIWSLADRDDYHEVPLRNANKSTFEKIRPITFFEKKKLFVNSLAMCFGSVYYLCNGDRLYASGLNTQGMLGIGKKSISGELMPIYVQDKVLKIFGAGVYAQNFFFITSQPDLLYGCGKNEFGELGVGLTGDQSSPTVVKKFQGSEILTVSSGIDHSVLITNKGQTYSCGNEQINGHGVQKNIFTLIPQLKEKKAVQLETGASQTLILTDKNELYAWGFANTFLYPTKTYNHNTNNIPTKISLPGFFTKYLGSKDMIRIACGAYDNFLYLGFKSTLLQDLALLFESKKFCDCEIGASGNKIPAHKTLIECRTKLTIEQIQKKLFGEKSINKEQTLIFLKWVYYDEISEKDKEKLEQTFNSLQLTPPPSVDKTLEKDIAQLYKDDDSKDFKILVKIDDDENEDEENEDEEGNYEEIAVHKFILLARSGLFREMFGTVNEKENTNKVKDYSQKTIESLEILIKYFYTNTIELTADEDPELMVDELSDAVEYYQLNDQCNFVSELNKIKKQL
ncbi:btk-binding protein-related [Anaeramoeba flamelloides]|uniref:Btk-binding protein-related n=1 Tax=Anaeramoeba flamelloides TaxID=1746091 RepID=A0AAV7Z6F6_9EUKA|nr:btk-binding protein-related [Anaeramoeba flamelloides]